MKKILLASLMLFLIVNLNSCKLFGLDDESILAKDVWQGDKADIYTLPDNDFVFSVSMSDYTLDFNKKTHRYVWRDNSSGDEEEGDWTYDKKNKILTLDPDGDDAVDLHVDKLQKKVLELSTDFDMDGDGTDDHKVIYHFKRD